MRAPLTTKLKFQLALKTSVDPVKFIGTGLVGAINQAGAAPDYGQSMQGYGERVGAIAAGGISNIMIGGAILSSLLHRTRATSTRAQARRHLAVSTRSLDHSSARETTVD
jgi:hypothetical protein